MLIKGSLSYQQRHFFPPSILCLNMFKFSNLREVLVRLQGAL